MSTACIIFIYRVQPKKYPQKLFAIFSAIARNFNAKFYTIIASSHSHKKAKRHLTFFCCCKVTNFIVEQHRDFTHSKT